MSYNKPMSSSSSSSLSSIKIMMTVVILSYCCHHYHDLRLWWLFSFHFSSSLETVMTIVIQPIHIIITITTNIINITTSNIITVCSFLVLLYGHFMPRVRLLPRQRSLLLRTSRTNENIINGSLLSSWLSRITMTTDHHQDQKMYWSYKGAPCFLTSSSIPGKSQLCWQSFKARVSEAKAWEKKESGGWGYKLKPMRLRGM